MRTFRTFTYRDASYRISPADDSRLYGLICAELKAVRDELELYIKKQPEFLTSLAPIELLPGAPETAGMMAAAALKTGIGPMAAVAGTSAAAAAFKARAGGSSEIIIENGGDIFILPAADGEVQPVTAGIFSGLGSRFSSLALRIIPGPEGTAVCSSSSRMGHSLSLGDCDLCTAVSADAALADAAATLGCNLVKTESDLRPAAEKIAAVSGIEGVLLIKNEQLAIAGRMPEIVRHKDQKGLDKITGTFIM